MCSIARRGSGSDNPCHQWFCDAFALVIENRKKQRFLAKRSLIFSLTDQRGQPRVERIDGVERSVAGLQPQR
jgi:hypothetical protein